MSNIKRTSRAGTLTTDDGTLTGTVGPLPIAYGAMLGADARGSAIGDAMFRTVADGSTFLPARYLSICCHPTGSDAANVDASYVVEFWDEAASLWCSTAPLRVFGATVMDAAMSAGLTDVGNAHSVKVPRQCTLARVFVAGLIANQGITFTAVVDNDD